MVHEVFATSQGKVLQDDAARIWIVDFAGRQAEFDYRCLLKLRDAIYRIDIEQKLLLETTAADVEIIFICACDHTFVLTLLEVIALRELLQGTFVMFELNTIIHRALYTSPAEF